MSRIICSIQGRQYNKNLKLKNIKKKSKNIFKVFFYKIFTLFYGNIKGKIKPNDDSRIKTEIVKKENSIEYKIFKVQGGRLYTDRIHDTAIILDNSIIEGPSFQLRPINNEEVEKNIVFEKGTPRRKKFLNGKVLSMLTGGAGNDNYWHWIFDVLPRIALFEKLIDLNTIDFFLIPSTKRKFQKQSLNLLNIPEKKLLSSEFFRHIVCKELIVADHPYVITKDSSHDILNIPIWISKWLKEKYVKNETNKNLNLPKKIFIDRSNQSLKKNKLRSVTNESEVKNFLSEKGFTSIVLEDLDFEEQVKIFNNAEFIVGLHGAGFANICFCKPSTKIVEFRSDTAGKMIENLAISNGLTHKFIESKPTKFKDNYQSGHIRVSIDLLNKIINNLN